MPDRPSGPVLGRLYAVAAVFVRRALAATLDGGEGHSVACRADAQIERPARR